METETCLFVVEWKIENFSHWCAEVHGDCIKSETFWVGNTYMELYPKGISGQGEHLVLRFCDIHKSFSGQISYFSDGSQLCKQELNVVEWNKAGLELPPGPKFEDVLSIIREDFITVKLRMKNQSYFERHMCTTINCFKLSLGINPWWIEDMKTNETKDFFYIKLSPNDNNDNLERIWLKIFSKNNLVRFRIRPKLKNPLAVEMSLRGSDGTVDNNCGKKEYVFRGNRPWTFPDSLTKKEFFEKRISLFFCLKTKNLIQSPLYISCPNSCVSIESKNKICFPQITPSMDHYPLHGSYRSMDPVLTIPLQIQSPSYENWDNSCTSVEWNNTPCFSEKAASAEPVTSNKAEVLTKDSASQTSYTRDMPNDSVLLLSKELMCLYQDQDSSDITLKCDNVSIPVHRAILSARSPVFKTMLSTDMAEAASGEVDIRDLDPSTLNLFLTYLYTGVVEELQCDSALKLYYAADKYQVPFLKKECSKFLCDNISVSTVCDILSLADRHNDDHLTTVSHDFILDNYNAVLKSKEWDTLKKSEPLLAVNTVTLFAVEDRVRKHRPQ